MPTAGYAVQIDWDEDGDFDDPAETLSRDVIAAEWALGLARAADSVAAPSWAALTLRDPARRYTPENPDSPLYGSLTPRKKVRITSTHGGLTRVHFTGWTESFTPNADRTTRLRCAGVEALLERAEVFLPLGLNQRADQVIAAVLAQVAYPPALSGYWLLGTARLGRSTRLPDTTTYADLEAGLSVFAYVGDNWGDGVSAWGAIRAATESERGRCFVDRSGRVVFWNRHHLHKQTAVAASFTGRDARFAIGYSGEDLVNRAVVTCHPRDVGSSPQALWTLAAPLAVPPGGSRTVRARFADQSGARIGGLDLVTPVAGVDYQANAAPDGSGTDLTASVSVTLAPSASSAVLTFSNGGPLTAYLLAGAVVRGLRLADWGPLDAEYEDQTSITHYGRRTLGLDLPLLSDAEEAARLARHLVVEGRDPRGRVEAVTLRNTSDDALAALLGLTLGDRITLTDARSGHQRDYHIIGERHALRRGGAEHETAWTLAPASPVAYWRLGVSGAGELGAATRLAY